MSHDNHVTIWEYSSADKMQIASPQPSTTYPTPVILWARTWSRKTSNNISRSCGPAMCSGWNCTLHKPTTKDIHNSHSTTCCMRISSFGVESWKFSPEERLCIVNNALICLVVLIREQYRPVCWQGIRIDGKAVVLSGDVAATSANVSARLVVSSVTIP